MLKLIFATHNKHKLEEVRSLLPFDGLQIKSLNEINCFEEIEENADTLEGNALIKARFVSDNYRLNCFADDTGLEIDALNGAPGVYSARYAGSEKSSQANMLKVLSELEHEEKRTARFRTVIALILDGEEYLFEGRVEGEIIREARGKDGFGYDPIFVPQGYQQTFAEMPLSQKNTISHRYRAIQMFRDYMGSLNYF